MKLPQKMPLLKLHDEDGESLPVIDVDGTYIVPFPDIPTADQERNCRSIKAWSAREDDVLLWAYPKSGQCWAWAGPT